MSARICAVCKGSHDLPLKAGMRPLCDECRVEYDCSPISCPSCAYYLLEDCRNPERRKTSDLCERGNICPPFVFPRGRVAIWKEEPA